MMTRDELMLELYLANRDKVGEALGGEAQVVRMQFCRFEAGRILKLVQQVAEDDHRLQHGIAKPGAAAPVLLKWYFDRLQGRWTAASSFRCSTRRWRIAVMEDANFGVGDSDGDLLGTVVCYPLAFLSLGAAREWCEEREMALRSGRKEG